MLEPPVYQGTWAAWENGSKPPSLGNALGIARITEGVIDAASWVGAKRKRPRKKSKLTKALESSTDLNGSHSTKAAG